MIGSVKRLIVSERVPFSDCPDCKSHNTLIAHIYSEVFVLKILPFVTGKSATVECSNCKKMYPLIYMLPAPIAAKVEYLKSDNKHAWFLYIGYALIGFGLIMGIYKEFQKGF